MMFEFLTLDYEPCPDDVKPSRFGFECPKRPGFMCTGLLLRDNPDGIVARGRTWNWNGDRTRPSFHPSVNCTRCSHGWITDGVWRDA